MIYPGMLPSEPENLNKLTVIAMCLRNWENFTFTRNLPMYSTNHFDWVAGRVSSINFGIVVLPSLN